MDTKQFTEEVKGPFYDTYQAAVQKKGYTFGLERGRSAPNNGLSLEVYIKAMPGSLHPIVPETLTAIKELVGDGKTFKNFYVNVRYIESAFAFVDEKDF